MVDGWEVEQEGVACWDGEVKALLWVGGDFGGGERRGGDGGGELKFKQAPTGYLRSGGAYTFPSPKQLRYPKSDVLSTPGKGLP